MTDITRTGGAPLPRRMFVLLSVRLRFCIFGGRGATLLFSVVVWLHALPCSSHTHSRAVHRSIRSRCVHRPQHVLGNRRKIEYKTDFLFYLWSDWCRGVKG